jgi:hypothetical protein
MDVDAYIREAKGRQWNWPTVPVGWRIAIVVTALLWGAFVVGTAGYTEVFRWRDNREAYPSLYSDSALAQAWNMLHPLVFISLFGAVIGCLLWGMWRRAYGALGAVVFCLYLVAIPVAAVIWGAWHFFGIGC